MGVIITKRDLRSLDKTRLMRPLIFCNPDKELEERAVSINVLLAEQLTSIKPKRRTMRMEICVQKVLSSLPEDTVIKDFDVMFNPEYEVDILRIMIAQYKIKPFDLIWPGKYQEGKLVYAEEGYRDYKVFEISKYDVTCVI